MISERGTGLVSIHRLSQWNCRCADVIALLAGSLGDKAGKIRGAIFSLVFLGADGRGRLWTDETF
jgi:hypothetical protein